MTTLKAISQSWFFAGAIIWTLGLTLIWPTTALVSSSKIVILMAGFTWATLIFSVPSTLLNWLYDKQGYAKTQRVWMRYPKGLMGKIGYILMGSITLWLLLAIGIGLAGFVIWGLMSLGQAAWST
ncbi:hypothetical protein N9W89_09895 [Hellea sp.]|nr:hypothetical protein [Hellea sp.]